MIIKSAVNLPAHDELHISYGITPNGAIENYIQYGFFVENWRYDRQMRRYDAHREFKHHILPAVGFKVPPFNSKKIWLASHKLYHLSF